MDDHSTFDDYLRPKEYEFAFSPRALVILLSGLGLLISLIFVGGVSVGTRLAPAARSAYQPPEAIEQTPPSELGLIVVQPLSELFSDAGRGDERLDLEGYQPPAVEAGAGGIGGEVDTVFELQLALYFHRIEANHAIESWRQRGYEPYLVEVLSSTGVPRYTLRLGPFVSMGEALEAQAAFVDSEGEAATIRFRDVPG